MKLRKVAINEWNGEQIPGRVRVVRDKRCAILRDTLAGAGAEVGSALRKVRQ